MAGREGITVTAEQHVLATLQRARDEQPPYWRYPMCARQLHHVLRDVPSEERVSAMGTLRERGEIVGEWRIDRLWFSLPEARA